MLSDSEAFDFIFVLADCLRRSYDVKLSSSDEPKLTVADAHGDCVDVVLERPSHAARYRICLMVHGIGEVARRIPVDASNEDLPDVMAVVEEHLRRR